MSNRFTDKCEKVKSATINNIDSGCLHFFFIQYKCEWRKEKIFGEYWTNETILMQRIRNHGKSLVFFPALSLALVVANINILNQIDSIF